MREAVKEFAEGMEKKLQKHDGDYGRVGWLGCDEKYLIDRMKEEIREFEESGDPDEMFDVGNLAMMIRENIRFGKRVVEPLMGGSR